MKKILFSIAAAICVAMNLSALKAVSRSFANTYYYFSVAPGRGNKVAFYNADLQKSYGKIIPTSNPCVSLIPGRYKCVVGFTVKQLTNFHFSRLETLAGAQIPRTVTYWRTVP